MSKVSRRKEIQEKESLQLKFQLALAENNKNISSWLPGAISDTTTDGHDRQVFLDLPIVANGAGLSDIEKNNHSRTVGDFLQAEGTPKNVKQEHVNDVRNGSKAMAALMNRMRSDTRRTLRESANKVHKTPAHRRKQADEVRQSKNATVEESDDEQLKMEQIGSKKSNKVVFGKKKRPF